MPALSPWLKRWWPSLAIAAAVLLVWGHSVTFQFVWDDKYFIEDLQSIRSFSSVPEMFYSLEAQSSYPQGFVLFRPLRTLHYAVLFALGGGETPRPWLFHFANLLWHAAASILLFHVLLRVFQRNDEEPDNTIRAAALLGALAFAVHPVVSEVVCWAKSLDDLMATTFVLASCLALLRWNPENRRGYWAALGSFALALYSKESAVPFALFCVLLLAWRTRGAMMQTLRLSAPFLAVTLLFLIHRHLVIGRTSQTAPLSGSYVQTLVDTLTAGPIYARLFAGIPPFCIDYSYMTSGHVLTALPVLLGLALLIGLLATALLTLRRSTALIGAGGLWILLFLLPFSNLVPMMQFCAERFVYLPLIGGIVVLGCVLLMLPRRNLALGISAVIVIGWSALAWQRSWIWRDPVTLFVQTHVEGPTSARVRDNALAAVFNLPHMRTVFTRVSEPGKPSGIIAAPVPGRTIDWPSVENTLQQLRSLFPDEMTVVRSTAIVRALQGRPEEAIPDFDLVAQKRPDDPAVWLDLAEACLAAKRFEDAEQSCRHALKLQPALPAALEKLARVHWQQKNYPAALATYGQLRAGDPGNPEFARRIAELTALSAAEVRQ